VISQSEAWTALRKHHGAMQDIHLRTLFTEDPKRGEGLALAGAAGLRARIDAMVSGEQIKLESPEEPALRHDGSTNALIRRYRRLRDRA